MSAETNLEHAKLLARLNEKAEQFSEEAEGIHDDVRKLAGQVTACGQQVAMVGKAARLIEERIADALEVDRKTESLAAAAAESAGKSASAATQKALTDLLMQIADVTATADLACRQAGRRMIFANAWGVACIMSALVGFACGALFIHYIDADRFLTTQQAQQAEEGKQFEALWLRASKKEREYMAKIATRPAPAP